MKVLAGDFTKGPSSAKLVTTFWGGNFKRLIILRSLFRRSKYKAEDILSMKLVDEQSKTSILGKVAWGSAGLLALGGLGMLAGVLGGGNRNTRVVLLPFSDGRSVMLQCSAKEYLILLAALYNKSDAYA